MAERSLGTEFAKKPSRPKTLERPIRRWIKKAGKRLTRWLALYQGRQGLVPDAPVLDTAHFPFLKEFEDRRAEILPEVRRSEERRAGTECGSTCRSWWSPTR